MKLNMKINSNEYYLILILLRQIVKDNDMNAFGTFFSNILIILH